jgi:ankyrin repeat protein
MQAVDGRQSEAVRFLLSREANFRSEDNKGLSVFQLAVLSDSEKILEIFLDEKGLVRAGDREAEIGLLTAAREDKRDSIKYLLQKGVNINTQADSNGLTALMWTAGEGHRKATTILVEANADLNLQDNGGKTAVMYAAANSRKDTLKVLIKAKAKLNVRDNNGTTALGWAIRNEHKDTRKELQKAGAKQ